jgi:hypothetical protein
MVPCLHLSVKKGVGVGLTSAADAAPPAAPDPHPTPARGQVETLTPAEPSASLG